MHILLWIYLTTIGGLLAGAGLVHLIATLGAIGRRISDALCRAPMVDVVVFYFTALPWVIWPIVAGWLGLAVAVAAQITALLIWIALHELAHPAARRGPRIHGTIVRIIGRWRNHFAVWWTAWAVPVFWIVRFAEVFVYPPLTWSVRLPKYRHSEWINVSRHKFSGLVGYDLIWCLYCDWMTGVWSLAGEMLRNVESFWCPIRFYSDKKCDNCKVDFPDIDGGWVPADRDMNDVTAVLKDKYHGDGRANPWFGHPARLTVEGAEIQED